MIATLRRRDQLVADGAREQSLRSLAGFSECLRVVEGMQAESQPVKLYLGSSLCCLVTPLYCLVDAVRLATARTSP